MRMFRLIFVTPSPAFPVPFSMSMLSAPIARLTGQGEIAALEGVEFGRARLDAELLGHRAPAFTLV